MSHPEAPRSWVHRSLRHVWKEWIRPFGLFFLIVAPLKSTVIDWNWVPTGSMKPTIVEGDLVVVNKLAYGLRLPFTLHQLSHWGDPQRGDIVVCFSPVDAQRLVKRVIGLPGDVIETRRNTLYVNGEPLTYTPVDAAAFERDVFEDPAPLIAVEHLAGRDHLVMVLPNRAARRSMPPFVVPAGQYFLMGDSRDNSSDSRVFGAVARDQIIGRATGVLLSLDLQRRLLPRLQRFGRLLMFTAAAEADAGHAPPR